MVLGVSACQLPPLESNRMASGTELASGQMLYSPNKAFSLTMATDGDLVAGDARGTMLWNTKTSGHPGAKLVMRTNGSLVVQSASGRVYWSTPTGWITGATMELGDDANLVVKGAAGQPVWANGISTAGATRIPASQRRASTHQVVLTKLYEGFVASAPYLDSFGNCTIGYGHLIRMGSCTDADRAKTWDPDALFAADVTEHERRLKSSLGTVPMTQREFDALFDYVYNRGSLTASTSPKVYAAMTASPPNYAAVGPLLRSYGNTLLRGLCDRRYDEAEVFDGGRYDRTYTC